MVSTGIPVVMLSMGAVSFVTLLGQGGAPGEMTSLMQPGRASVVTTITACARRSGG